MFTEQDLWSALTGTEKNYNQAMKIITENPSFVNSVREPGGNSVLISALFSKKIQSKEFIDFILQQPELNFSYFASKTSFSNMQYILSYTTAESFDLVVGNPKMYSDKTQFTYGIAKEQLADSEARLTRLKARNPQDPKKLAEVQADVDERKEKLAKVRDASLRYAILNKNTILLDQLEAEKAEPDGELLNGDSVFTLFTKESNPEVFDWYNKGLKIAAQNLLSNPNRLFNSQQAQNINNQIKALENEKNQKTAQILHNATAQIARLASSI